MRLLSVVSSIMISMAIPAAAEMQKVDTFEEFLSYVQGKNITRPLVKLVVTRDGRIEGTGAAWPVEGNWNWQDGYFCRELNWGGDNLGYNCQEVRAEGNRIRFTSDRGSGRTALFRLN